MGVVVLFSQLALGPFGEALLETANTVCYCWRVFGAGIIN